jgi:hypothetical protein
MKLEILSKISKGKVNETFRNTSGLERVNISNLRNKIKVQID